MTNGMPAGTHLFSVCSIMSILRGLRSDPAGRGGPIEVIAPAGGGAGSCLTAEGSAMAAAMPGGMNLGTYRPPAPAPGAGAVCRTTTRVVQDITCVRGHCSEADPDAMCTV